MMRRLKLYFALLGFILTLVGLYLDNRQVIWAAIAVLIAAFIIRLWERRRR
jgi:hypothetical protein